MSKNPELNNKIWQFGIEFFTSINNKNFEVYAPYRIGQIFESQIVKDAIVSIIFGCVISEKKDENSKDYEKFLGEFKLYLLKEKSNLLKSPFYFEPKGKYEIFIDELIDYLDNTEPEFYIVESS